MDSNSLYTKCIADKAREFAIKFKHNVPITIKY